ncbi:MAG: riboflavin synthase [Planctomycetes bacterium]|nr:riboflavin synthase [Planctomycetota bacterium]
MSDSTKLDEDYMFTGLIESVCTVRSLVAGGRDCCLQVDLGSLAQDDRIGSSFAINGVCLTATRYQGTVASFEVSRETLEKSGIGALRSSAKVNVERALRLGDRMGGHMVQGHIDGTATIAAIDPEGDYVMMSIAADASLLKQIVLKGSVAVDGVSLTVAGLDDKAFSVALIPETLRQTILGEARVGDRVNIETDIIGKTVMRYLDTALPQEGALTVDRLRKLGY